MDTHETLISRRTTHTFTTEKVSAATIDRALHAANHAPCHKLTFPWRFTIAGPQSREQLSQLGVHIKAATRPLSEADAHKIREKILNASHLLVPSQVRCPDLEQAREDYAACACAIQNLMLSLTADQVASKWSTGMITRHADTYRILGINPALEEIIGFIWVGHGDLKQPICRPPIEAVVRETR